ncbi:Histidine kinase-, DNA gyrase B-, and HSP90-like ATPase [Thermosyntropha lipolytica DSM 11003]|uniref:histidine kinase n=1 Tax=Thermosyntropha lipolytica DSM 11003 TaxID=1123382 RepID=A0A1M5LW83_9FIRM|nr:HAMP domain-containing sensor histidine kinase [Thermosyntropha lipolytica]SHG69382.1 Histidine kinase-, DNA gyrase B-, and HSP90-like ATPase [Thermosyntropha lipolytica DSM 11003]
MNNSLISHLLEDNTQHHNFFILKLVSFLLAVIVPVTILMKISGLTTPNLSLTNIVKVVTASALILLFLRSILKVYGKHNASKWLVITSIFSIFMMFRTAAYAALEVHTILYLTIILSIFYFDYRLVIYATFLCIAGDYVFSLFFPQSIPTGGSAAEQFIRYLNYTWAGMAGSMGTYTMRQLLHLASELKYTNDRLQEDIEKEKKLEQILKDFIAAASHELKSPLGIIQSYAEALRDGLKPNKQEQYLNTIINETSYMGKLVNDMLDLSRLENGYAEITKQEFDIYQLTAKIIQRWQSWIEEKNLQCQIINQTAYPRVIGDYSKIEICLTNFITNALQNTPPGQKITIHIQEEEKHILWAIENEGSHLAEKDLQKVWLPFYRTDKSHSKEYRGTGLGLAITQNILNLHKSHYGVKNTSKGVCFYFSLPQAFSSVQG